MKLGFSDCFADHSLFNKCVKDFKIFILIYVDDIIIIGSNKHEIENVIDSLKSEFSMRELGKPEYFLRIHVKKTKLGLHLSQTKYIANLLRKYNFFNEKLATPQFLIIATYILIKALYFKILLNTKVL